MKLITFLILIPSLLFAQGHKNWFTPKLLRFQGDNVILSDSTTKTMLLSMLPIYLHSDSGVLISMHYFRNQNNQIAKNMLQIIEQDTTIKSLSKAIAVSNKEIENRDGKIREKDIQLADLQGIIDGADLRLKNCRKAGWKRTEIGGGIGIAIGVIGTVITFVALR